MGRKLKPVDKTKHIETLCRMARQVADDTEMRESVRVELNTQYERIIRLYSNIETNSSSSL